MDTPCHTPLLLSLEVTKLKVLCIKERPTSLHLQFTMKLRHPNTKKISAFYFIKIYMKKILLLLHYVSQKTFPRESHE